MPRACLPIWLRSTWQRISELGAKKGIYFIFACLVGAWIQHLSGYCVCSINPFPLTKKTQQADLLFRTGYPSQAQDPVLGRQQHSQAVAEEVIARRWRGPRVAQRVSRVAGELKKNKTKKQKSFLVNSMPFFLSIFIFILFLFLHEAFPSLWSIFLLLGSTPGPEQFDQAGAAMFAFAAEAFNPLLAGEKRKMKKNEWMV